jgi:hypothetical protein
MKLPRYCCCSADEFAAAQIEYNRLRLDPAWIQMAGFRRSALAAIFNNAGFIAPLLAIEFKDVIESKGYQPLPTDGSANAERVRQERAAFVVWEQRQREAAKKSRPMTLREASEFKSPLEYHAWLQTAEGQAALKAGWF